MKCASWLCVAMMLLAPMTVLADEHIIFFATEIVVTPTDELVVTDTIRASSTGERIKFGILRELPRELRFDDGPPQTPAYTVSRVQVDGEEVAPTTRVLAHTQRVYLGRKDKLLPMGVHEFLMQLQAKNAIRMQEGTASLSWDVTGSYFALPIAKIVAVIKLPRTVNPQTIRSAAFTGNVHQRSKDYSVGVDEEGNIRFETTRTLLARETLQLTLHWERPG